MTRKISTAEAKAKLSEIVSRVAHGGERYVIERRGKPMAAVVSLEDLATIEPDSAKKKPKGILALKGAWAELGDDGIDEFVREIYESRSRDRGRPVDLTK